MHSSGLLRRGCNSHQLARRNKPAASIVNSAPRLFGSVRQSAARGYLQQEVPHTPTEALSGSEPEICSGASGFCFCQRARVDRFLSYWLLFSFFLDEHVAQRALHLGATFYLMSEWKGAVGGENGPPVLRSCLASVRTVTWAAAWRDASSSSSVWIRAARRGKNSLTWRRGWWRLRVSQNFTPVFKHLCSVSTQRRLRVSVLLEVWLKLQFYRFQFKGCEHFRFVFYFLFFGSPSKLLVLFRLSCFWFFFCLLRPSTCIEM